MNQAVIKIDEEQDGQSIKMDCQYNGVPAIQVLEGLQVLVKQIARNVYQDALKECGGDAKLVEGYIDAQQKARTKRTKGQN